MYVVGILLAACPSWGVTVLIRLRRVIELPVGMQGNHKYKSCHISFQWIDLATGSQNLGHGDPVVSRSFFQKGS